MSNYDDSFILMLHMDEEAYLYIDSWSEIEDNKSRIIIIKEENKDKWITIKDFFELKPTGRSYAWDIEFFLTKKNQKIKIVYYSENQIKINYKHYKYPIAQDKSIVYINIVMNKWKK